MVENELPKEIIEYILTRLPVRSLIQFNSVSKQWRSIISDPRFAKLHWRLASEQKTFSHRLLISTGSQLASIDLEETQSVGDNPSINKLSYPAEKPGSGLRVNLVGSCNGLVCVANDVTTLVIWNPSTGFSHKLPEPHLPRECVLKYFGFGYLSATDDYKVVIGTDYNYVNEMKIFSLRAQTWKRIESPVWLPIQRDGVVLNEALYWLDGIGIDIGDKPAIFAFDLAKEKFRKMSLPFVKANIYGYNYRLGVSCDGCLYVMCYKLVSCSRVYVDFWVMREYGVAGYSWTKLKFKAFKEHEQISRIEPILLMETGAVVAKISKRGMELIWIDRHEEGKPGESSTVVARYKSYNAVVAWDSCGMMIKYVASLQLLDDYQDGVEEHKVKRLKTQHKVEARRRGLD